MDKKKINRRNFLKKIGSFSLGALLLPLGKAFHQMKNKGLNVSSREAKFYRSSDDLAG